MAMFGYPKYLEWLDEAARLLRELGRTPNMSNIHFEFNCDSGGIPVIDYEIKRFPRPQERETDDV